MDPDLGEPNQRGSLAKETREKTELFYFIFSFWPAERADPVARGPPRRTQTRPVPRRILVRDWGRGHQLGPHPGDTLRHILLQSHPGIARDWGCGHQLGPHPGDTLRHILLQSHPGIGGVVTSWVRTLETPYVTYCYNLIQV
jgi:hypothetical protein